MELRSNLGHLLKRKHPLFEALTKLLHPLLEISIHNPSSGEIIAIYHNITQRKVGEMTPMRELTENGFYYKRNGDHRPLKCGSIPLRDDDGNELAVVCLLIDTTLFQETFQICQSLLSLPESSRSLQVTAESCQAKIALVIDDFLRRSNLSLARLNRDQKRQAVQLLNEAGIFSYKNSVPEVAGQLRLSRATVYNYLKEI